MRVFHILALALCLCNLSCHGKEINEYPLRKTHSKLSRRLDDDDTDNSQTSSGTHDSLMKKKKKHKKKMNVLKQDKISSNNNVTKSTKTNFETTTYVKLTEKEIKALEATSPSKQDSLPKDADQEIISKNEEVEAEEEGGKPEDTIKAKEYENKQKAAEQSAKKEVDEDVTVLPDGKKKAIPSEDVEKTEVQSNGATVEQEANEIVSTAEKPKARPIIKPRKPAQTEVEWQASYQSHAQIDSVNKGVTHYIVAFDSFKCFHVKCRCEQINLKITTGSIERELSNLDCDQVFTYFKFSILPGIKYEFEMSPIVRFESENYKISKGRTFAISESASSNILSFELFLEMDKAKYVKLNLEKNALSQKLKQEIIAISHLNKHQISIAVKAPSEHSKVAKIGLIVDQIVGSTVPQIALEKIRSLSFAQNGSLLADIIKHSVLMQMQAITSREYHNTAEEEVAGSGYEEPSPAYGKGIKLLCLILLIGACVACAKFVPAENFVMAGKVCKILCIEALKLLTKCVDYFGNSDALANARATAHSFFYPTPNYETHEVLNLSDSETSDLRRKNNESGIELVKRVMQQHGIPNMDREKYVKILSDNWLTTIEQLQQLNVEDWKRFGFPDAISNAIRLRLDPSEDDGVSTIESSNVSNDLAYPLSIKIDSGRISEEVRDDDTSFSDF